MIEAPFPALRANACLGLVAPAHALSDGAVRAGIACLEALGFRVRPHLPPRGAAIGRLSACDKARAEYLVRAFEDHEVDAVIAVCGGYGVMRLWPYLPDRLFRGTIKPLIGYSDVTALLGLADARGTTAIHGPMLCDLPEADQATLDALLSLLTGDIETYNSVLGGLTNHLREQVSAPIEGTLFGGNLSLIAATLATPFSLRRTDRTLMLLEDWNEPAYRIDRMLMQLHLSGMLDGCDGVLLGYMTNVEGEREQLGTSIFDRLRSLAPEGSAVVFGLPAGHEMPNAVLALGRTYSVSESGLQIKG